MEVPEQTSAISGLHNAVQVVVGTYEGVEGAKENLTTVGLA